MINRLTQSFWSRIININWIKNEVLIRVNSLRPPVFLRERMELLFITLIKKNKRKFWCSYCLFFCRMGSLLQFGWKRECLALLQRTFYCLKVSLGLFRLSDLIKLSNLENIYIIIWKYLVKKEDKRTALKNDFYTSGVPLRQGKLFQLMTWT